MAIWLAATRLCARSTPKKPAGLGRHILPRCYSTRPHETINVQGASFVRDSKTNVPASIISKLPQRLYMKPEHPLGILRTLIEGHFPNFTTANSLSPIVSVFKNFDELGFPHDHPGRNITDSYYINSTTMLRTHTSAHEIEVFRQGADKWLLTADVYRRDEIDASHYPVFHQVEGARTFDVSEDMDALAEENARLAEKLASANIIIEDDTQVTPQNPYQNVHDPAHAALVTENLKSSLNSLILSIFGARANATKEEPLRVRWIEAYFPFTSPSYEVEVFFQGKWLEILGCGVVKQATLDQSGIENRIGWAFGLGLERIAMVLFSIPDIRLFWSEDPRFLEQFTPGKITAFRSYSRFPPCYKDVSFWTSDQVKFHENDLCDVVRDTAGDLVEDVKLIDEFVNPKTQRKSLCYRINYRSMDRCAQQRPSSYPYRGPPEPDLLLYSYRSLSNEEVNEIQSRVVAKLVEKFAIEPR
ncbi:hypothetical protein BOTBODRAFT_178069 [Botryobasidium botryosum FD-172 SS1]|uniref:Phenylalanine--tRNA ligase, mitochondrial n=1 Tax=Botryobasidium botryosum (strain FD-172 SS1) TaxID=930990 RepID=A0A067M4V4_BOTB1|nr:hypothetical protein BOTBODRAFT_178069 [Botryobasidium botryosum FD-172 SS1]